jgi:hypothetical protein
VYDERTLGVPILGVVPEVVKKIRDENNVVGPLVFSALSMHGENGNIRPSVWYAILNAVKI